MSKTKRIVPRTGGIVRRFPLGKRAEQVARHGIAIPELVIRSGLSPEEMAVYVALKWMWGMSDGTNAVAGIAHLTGMSEMKVFEALSELAAMGVIEVQRPTAPSNLPPEVVLPWWDTRGMVRRMRQQEGDDAGTLPVVMNERPNDKKGGV